MTLVQDINQQLDAKIGTGSFADMSAKLSRTLHKKVLDGGDNTRQVFDTLHGKPLGHPLHPLLTDITVGSWTTGLLFDLLSRLTRSPRLRSTANQLTLLGTLSAIPTVVTGVADFSAIKRDAAGYGAAHGILNGIAFFCFARSSVARLRNRHSTGFFFSAVGLLFAIAGSWIGGELVFRHRVGVNHAQGDGSEQWQVVIAAEDLERDTPTRVDFNGQPVLLFRVIDDIYAIDAVCSHAGGPLEEGTVDGTCITCPWHQSVFDMRDGSVVHCPATTGQQRYQARIFKGSIEVRRYIPRLNRKAQSEREMAMA